MRYLAKYYDKKRTTIKQIVKSSDNDNIYNINEEIFNDKKNLPIYILNNVWPIGDIKIKPNDLLDCIISSDFNHVDNNGKTIIDYYISSYEKLNLYNFDFHKRRNILNKILDFKQINEKIIYFLIHETYQINCHLNEDILLDKIRLKLNNSEFLDFINEYALLKDGRIKKQNFFDSSEPFLDKKKIR